MTPTFKVENFFSRAIPEDFQNYWKNKKGMQMTLEQCWEKWQPYWTQRQYGPEQPEDHGDSYVLGRYGDQGPYTVENCRVITHRENTLERNHRQCAEKLKNRVGNPEGGRSIPKNRNGGARISTPRGEFENCAEAAEAYGMHRTSMWHRVRSARWRDFYFIE